MGFILMLAVLVFVVGCYVWARSTPRKAAPVVFVPQVPKTLGEVLVFGVVGRWGERLEKALKVEVRS